MSPHRKRHSPNHVNWLIVLAFAVLCLGGGYFLSGLGPKSPGQGGGAAGAADETTLALLERSEEMERLFDERILEGRVDEEDIEILRKAVDLQERYIAALPALDFTAEGRLQQLKRKYGEYMGEILLREAEVTEAEAAAIESIEPDRALVLYREALLIREEIRERYGSSSSNRTAEYARLERKVQEMDIRPLYERSLESEAEAGRFEERGELEAAVEKYAEAARLQEEINRQYPGLSLAKPLRVSRLREKEARVLSGQLKRQIDQLISEGNDFLYEEDYPAAASAFGRARELQRSLTLEYPRSPYASRAREETLQIRQQNAAAFPDYLEIRGMEARLNEALFFGNYSEASLLLKDISNRLSQFDLRFSRSNLPLDVLRERVLYLRRKESQLERVSGAVAADLVPLPTNPQASMSATEVPQYLYELVMDGNPSRNVGGDLPVETVALGDVELFLLRLQWMLARETRLPTAAEFLAVARDAASDDDLEILTVESGAESTRPVSSGAADGRGFRHLLGNVSELVRVDGASAGAARIGGSLLNSADEVRRLEPVPIDPGERNRMMGFRFVVGDDLQPTNLPADPDI
ncbi:MAG: formylglycine-generating enzyme family protein [Puniceicoccaceae bacterium]